MADSKVKDAVEKVVDKVKGLVEVELKNAKSGVYQIFHAHGNTVFVDGKAKVTQDVADELKITGQIK